MSINRRTIIEREETDTRMIVERVAPRPGGNGAEPYLITVSVEPVASDSFVTTFSLPPESPDRNVSYAVLLEEAYVMPRSTFDKEPMADVPDADKGMTDPSLWQESGPRFAVRLEI